MWQLKVYSDQGSIVGRFDFKPPYKRTGNFLVLSDVPFAIPIEKLANLKFIEVQDDYGLIVARIPIKIGENRIQDNTLFVETNRFEAGSFLIFSEFKYCPLLDYDPEEQ